MRILDKFNKRKYKRLLPKNHSLEDIFLVSFPKSGNTWLRFLIANAIRVKYQINREVNFFSIHDIIPDVHISREILSQGPFGRSDLPRIVKSHSIFNPNYHRVVFLVRNPSDVMTSYYYYLKNYQSIPEEMSMSDFLGHKKFGIQAWVEHTRSWLQPQKIGQILKVVSYENLKKSTEKELGNIMSLMGVNLCETELEKAVLLSSKDIMKASAKSHMSTQIVKHHKTSFVRKAEIGRGEELILADKNIVSSATKEIIQAMEAQWFN